MWVEGNRRRAVAMIVLALVFLADIFMIFISKTGILMTAALVGLFVVHAEGWKRSLLIAAPSRLLSRLRFGRPRQRSVAWQKLRPISMPSTGTKGVPKQPSRPQVGSTSGAKLSNSLKKPRCLVTGLAAPNRCISLWRLLAVAIWRDAVPDPHNQFFAIAIQVGLVGGAICSLCGPCICPCLSAVALQARSDRRSSYRTSSGRFSIVTCRP